METFHFDLVLKSWKVLVKFCVTQHLFQKCFTKCLTDLSDDVTQNCHFLCFSFIQKFISMNRFIVPNLVNLWRFRKIRCKLSEIWEPKFANTYKEMYARGATGYRSNYYENQSNKLIIILNQSTNCYSFASISNETEKTKTTVISQNVSEIFNMLLSIWFLVK